MRGRGADIDGVSLRQVFDAGTGADLDLRVRAKIGRGARGNVLRDLVGDHPALRTDELGEDRGVIASAGADLQDRLAVSQPQRVERLRMQRGLAVVDAALGVDGDEDILIEARGVVGRGDAKKAARADPPRRPAGEIFARNGGEGRLDSRVA